VLESNKKLQKKELNERVFRGMVTYFVLLFTFFFNLCSNIPRFLPSFACCGIANYCSPVAGLAADFFLNIKGVQRSFVPA
jgi:hypothetical protein